MFTIHNATKYPMDLGPNVDVRKCIYIPSHLFTTNGDGVTLDMKRVREITRFVNFKGKRTDWWKGVPEIEYDGTEDILLDVELGEWASPQWLDTATKVAQFMRHNLFNVGPAGRHLLMYNPFTAVDSVGTWIQAETAPSLYQVVKRMEGQAEKMRPLAAAVTRLTYETYPDKDTFEDLMDFAQSQSAFLRRVYPLRQVAPILYFKKGNTITNDQIYKMLCREVVVSDSLIVYGGLDDDDTPRFIEQAKTYFR